MKYFKLNPAGVEHSMADQPAIARALRALGAGATKGEVVGGICACEGVERVFGDHPCRRSLEQSVNEQLRPLLIAEGIFQLPGAAAGGVDGAAAADGGSGAAAAGRRRRRRRLRTAQHSTQHHPGGDGRREAASTGESMLGGGNCAVVLAGCYVNDHKLLVGLLGDMEPGAKAHVLAEHAAAVARAAGKGGDAVLHAEHLGGYNLGGGRSGAWHADGAKLLERFASVQPQLKSFEKVKEAVAQAVAEVEARVCGELCVPPQGQLLAQQQATQRQPCTHSTLVLRKPMY